LNTIQSNGPRKTKYMYRIHIICLLYSTVRLFLDTHAPPRVDGRRRRATAAGALTALFASRDASSSSSSSCIGSSRAHRDSRDVAFTRAIIRARVVVVVDRRAPRCDIGGASSDVIDDKKRGGVATGVRVVASRDRGGGWRVVVVVGVVVVVRVICGVAWWGHGVVGARCVDVVVEDGRRGTTRLDKKRFETTRARG